MPAATQASKPLVGARFIRSQFPLLRDRQLRYLDSAATAQVPEAVIDAMRSFETEHRANVYGGVYRLARDSLAAYEETRAAVARFLGATAPSEIVFTYGATSAINLLAHSFGGRLEPGDEILISALEHHSNILPWQALARRRGLKLRVLPITVDGRLNLDQLPHCVTKRCRLIALTHCSNVTGALTDVAPIVAAARSVGARVMLDGAQRAPHGPVDVAALGIDFYAFSAHKAFGPTGVGVLWGRRELLDTMPPFMVGGQMIRRVTLEDAEFAPPPRRFEAGTPPIAGVFGFGAAIRWMESIDWVAASEHEKQLTRRILDAFHAMPRVTIIGPADTIERRGVVSFNIDGIASETVCRFLDTRGIALRHGHHCAQPLMTAFGIEGAARVSLGPYNDDDDVDALLAAVAEIKR